MSKSFKELESKMSPEARKLAELKTAAMLKQIKVKEN